MTDISLKELLMRYHHAWAVLEETQNSIYNTHTKVRDAEEKAHRMCREVIGDQLDALSDKEQILIDSIESISKDLGAGEWRLTEDWNWEYDISSCEAHSKYHNRVWTIVEEAQKLKDLANKIEEKVTALFDRKTGLTEARERLAALEKKKVKYSEKVKELYNLIIDKIKVGHAKITEENLSFIEDLIREIFKNRMYSYSYIQRMPKMASKSYKNFVFNLDREEEGTDIEILLSVYCEADDEEDISINAENDLSIFFKKLDKKFDKYLNIEYNDDEIFNIIENDIEEIREDLYSINFSIRIVIKGGLK